MYRLIQILRRGAISFLAIIAPIYLVTAGVASAQSKVVTISTGEWGPYVSEKLPHFGISGHIITAAFNKVGIKAEYQFFPWARAMKEAEERRADLTGIWYSNDERRVRFDYSNEVIGAANMFFHLKNVPFDWEDFDSFPDDTVGVTRGYSYSADFDKAAASGQVKTEVTGTDTLNFRKLLRGRIDAFVMAELAGYDLLKKEFSKEDLDRVTAHPNKVSSAPLHLLTAKGNPRGLFFIEKFNEGIAKLDASGELQGILDQYR